jgi:SPP1 family predicted phage head-tail adaptor
MATRGNIEAGRLRHRIDIDDKVESQDETGDPVVTWNPWAVSVPAAIEPLKGNEFAGANQLLGRASVLIIIRWRAGVLRTMRLRHGTTIYNIVDVMPDPDSGRNHLLLPAVSGTNQG